MPLHGPLDILHANNSVPFSMYLVILLISANMHLSLGLASVFLLLSPVAVFANDYAASCSPFSLDPNDNTMSTYCTPGDHGPRRLTKMDLNLCIANGDGQLVAQNK